MRLAAFVLALLGVAAAVPASASPVSEPYEFPTSSAACANSENGKPSFVNHWAVRLQTGKWASVWNGVAPPTSQLTRVNVTASNNAHPNAFWVYGVPTGDVANHSFAFGPTVGEIRSCSDVALPE